MRAAFLIGMIALIGVTACSRSERDTSLHDLKTYSGTPEEFSIIPAKPLVQPENYADLPTPTPGQGNRTDQTPLADAVAALGGNPARLSTGNGTPRGDSALIASASRFGRDSNIRTTLASEDLAFRKRKSLFTWTIVPRDDYLRAYERQTLDSYGWLERYRAAGARTPSAPPE
jgi:hypothetical protein